MADSTQNALKIAMTITRSFAWLHCVIFACGCDDGAQSARAPSKDAQADAPDVQAPTVDPYGDGEGE